MREPSEWQEEDIEALIREQRYEDLRLEYKRSDSLAKADKKKTEITKDVSAMANSAGGVIVYGIDEQRGSNGPIKLDGGIDPKELSMEWLEQVIDSGIQRRISGLRLHAVSISSTGKFVYVVSVPQSNWAPHMAADHRYHKRLGTTTAMMEDYEVRDVGSRSESPDLYLKILAEAGNTPGRMFLKPSIGNVSAVPVLYASCRLYLDLGLPVIVNGLSTWSLLEPVELLGMDGNRADFQVIRCNWSVPERHPILEGEEYPLSPVEVATGFDFKSSLATSKYDIGWELRAPKMAARLQGQKLWLNSRGPRIEGAFALTKVI